MFESIIFLSCIEDQVKGTKSDVFTDDPAPATNRSFHDGAALFASEYLPQVSIYSRSCDRMGKEQPARVDLAESRDRKNKFGQKVQAIQDLYSTRWQAS